MGHVVRVEVERSVSLFDIPYCHLTQLGLTFDDDINFDLWAQVGRALSTASRSIQWWLGDWLRFGERKYGEKYAQAIAATGLDEQTLMNYVYVANAIEISRRREILGWSHHAEVASLPVAEQEELLTKAELAKQSVREVRKAAEKKRASRDLVSLKKLLDEQMVLIHTKWKMLRPLVEEMGTIKVAHSYCDGFIKEIDWMLNAPLETISDYLETLIDGGAWDLDELTKTSGFSRATIEVVADHLVEKGGYRRGDQEQTEGARGATRKMIIPIDRTPHAAIDIEKGWMLIDDESDGDDDGE